MKDKDINTELDVFIEKLGNIIGLGVCVVMFFFAPTFNEMLGAIAVIFLANVLRVFQKNT